MSTNLVSVKCPMCNAALDVEEGQNPVVCSYCYTKIKVENSRASIYRGIDEAKAKQPEVEPQLHLCEMESEKITQERIRKVDVPTAITDTPKETLSNNDGGIVEGSDSERKKQKSPCEKINETILENESTQTIELSDYGAWSKTRVKWRNRGLAILLISAVMLLYTCFGDGGAFLGIVGVLGIFVGFIMIGSHLEPTGYVRKSKDNSGTKEIVKGAIIGGIVAGEAGAVVGAAIAKNNLDNKK